MESRRQIDVKSGECHVLHIAVDGAFDAYRMVRIVAHKLLWHVAHKPHQVLLAYLSIQTELHGTWIRVVEGTEVHGQLGFYFGVGRCQFQLRYGQLPVVHGYLGRQMTHLKTAFLFRSEVFNNKRGVGGDVFERFYAQVNVG